MQWSVEWNGRGEGKLKEMGGKEDGKGGWIERGGRKLKETGEGMKKRVRGE
jgi:hypothetical protein